MSSLLVWSFIAVGVTLLVSAIAMVLAKGPPARSSRKDRAAPVPRPEEAGGTRSPNRQGYANDRNGLANELDDRLEDVSSLTIPSPESSPTEVDAILIDMIRQASELPSAVLELSNLMREPDVPVRRVAEIVGTDPVLSARILRVANSAAVGRGKVTSLHQAVVFLGFNQVWILVNQMLTARSMKSAVRMDPSVMKSLWRHAAATATCAKHILLQLGCWHDEIGPLTMTCALLHDVGKFLLRGLGPMGQDETAQEGGEEVRHIVFRELEEYGTTHCRAGYLLSTYWNLPERISTTIAYHHHPPFSNWEDIPIHVRRPVILVALSDILANITGHAEGMPLSWRLHPGLVQDAGLPSSPSSLLTKELLADLRTTEKLLGEGGA